MKCPKCGTQNNDGAKFCCECGSKLESEKFICPKCRAFVKKGSKHCTNCGNELIWEEHNYNSIPIPTNTPSTKNDLNKNKNVILSNVFKYIICGLFFLAVFFMTVGWFGDLLKNPTTAISKNTSLQSLKYYFGDVFKDISTLKSEIYPIYKKYYFFELILMIADVTSYYLMVIVINVFSVLFTINLIKHLTVKEKIKTYMPIISVASITAHLMVVYLRFFTTRSRESLYVETTMGWGSAFLLTSVILMLIGIISMNITKHIFNHSGSRIITVNSLASAAYFFAFISLLLMFGREVYFVSAGIVTTKAPISFIIRSILRLDTNEWVVPLIGFIISCLCGIASLISYTTLLKSLSLKKIVMYSFSQFMFFASLFITLASSDNVFSQNNSIVRISSLGVISMMVSIVSIGGMIAAYVLSARKTQKSL